MGLLAGILRAEDVRPAVQIPPQELSDAINELNAKYVAERNTWYDFFVDQETTQFKIEHLLGGVDEGQKVGPDGRVLETRVTGKIEVAFPWERLGWALGWNYETFQSMSVGRLEREVGSKQNGNNARHVREMFRTVFAKDNWTHRDEEGHGDLTIRRLANGDGTTYPPRFNSDSESDDNHYLVSGYAADAMSATNNPFATLKAEIVEHFSSTTRVVAIINPAQRAEVMSAIPNFVDAPTAGITPGADTAVANPVAVSIPGTFIGVDGDSGTYVYVNEEGRVPANYVLSGAVGVPAPLYRRVPSVESLRGFRVESDDGEHYPFYKREWRDRFGYGVANRLSMAVMQLKASGDYETPAAYA